MMSQMSPKTVIVLNDYCYVNGGASRIAVDEAVGLAAQGLQVIFIGAVGPICDELKAAPLQVICLDQTELINVLRSPLVALQGLWNHKAGQAMRRVLAPLDPAQTVVHLHGYTKALSTSPVRVASGRGFRVICTLHDFFPACPNGGQFDYVENRPCTRVCLSVSCITRNCDKRKYVHKLYRVARSLAQKYLGGFPGRVFHYISLSNRSAALLQPYLPAQARYYPLENLIEAQPAPAADVAANRDLVIVGRLDPEKGIELLLKAVVKAGVTLTMVGDGPLRAMAEAVPQVRVTGWLPIAKVKDELRKARALVFPSLWYETFGLVIGEAASCGVPAIVSDVTAAAERVQDGVQGWHMRSGDLDDLVRCLELTKDDARVRAAGQAAYDAFWKHPPTRDNHLRGLIEIYGKVLSDQGAA